MKRTSCFLFALVGLLIAQEPSPQEQIARAIVPDEDPAEANANTDAPVRVPPLKHYARLWTDSQFTTRAMALPAASGPIFTDNLSLSGTFEDNGKLTAILIDRTTSNIVQAYIGEDNAEGFRISKIEPGPTPDKMRVQLQKGNQVGWLSFGEVTQAPAPAAPANALATQAPAAAAPVGVQVPNPLLPPVTDSMAPRHPRISPAPCQH
ncbi:MAG: hypothetical protein ACOYOF_16310 [Verrucomicrobiaceae bacterium]